MNANDTNPSPTDGDPQREINHDASPSADAVDQGPTESPESSPVEPSSPPASVPRDEAAPPNADAADEAIEEEDEEEEPTPAPRGPIEEVVEGEGDDEAMEWYILKVQSNRENSICDALRRRVAVEGLDRFFGEILVPTEDVAEFKNGKRRVVKRKLYPGYIVAHMIINEDTWFLVRETPGIGDFTGAAGKPTPMLPHEVERIVRAVRPDEESTEPIKTAIPFKVGDRVRIKEGTFENFEGDVEVIDEANGRVTVMINIFGRSTPVELEHWQAEAV